MTHIILVNAHTGIIVHNIRLEYDSKLETINQFIINKESEQGRSLERILVSNGFCRVMDPLEKIPIPIRMVTGRSAA
jgi:hypothetical protein